ncbi:MAG: hypothetical protein PHN42_05185 [Bacilli bacterium]|nr:hypothetical protein [Bacilli bacterium]
MYKIIIGGGETFLFVDNGTDEINEKQDLLGFLVNTENIIDLIKTLPISKYYVRESNRREKYKQVTEKQAMWLYQQLIDLQNEKADFQMKKINTFEKSNNSK